MYCSLCILLLSKSFGFCFYLLFLDSFFLLLFPKLSIHLLISHFNFLQLPLDLLSLNLLLFHYSLIVFLLFLYQHLSLHGFFSSLSVYLLSITIPFWLFVWHRWKLYGIHMQRTFLNFFLHWNNLQWFPRIFGLMKRRTIWWWLRTN